MKPAREGDWLDAAWLFWGGLVAATLIAALLRLPGLAGPSFWVDEFFTIARAGREPLDWNRGLGYWPSVASLSWLGADLSRVGLDNIAQWRALGVTEWNARLGPALVGIVSVPLLGVVARRVVGSGVALIAVLLLALHPWHIYWSQMARFYTALFLLSNLALLAFARGAATGSRATLGWAVVAAVLAYLCHPTALLVPGICLGCVALAWWWRVPGWQLARTAAASALAIALCLLLALLAGEAESAVGGASGGFAAQAWDPSLLVLLLGTAYRIDVAVAAVAGLSALALWWVRPPSACGFAERLPVGRLLAAVAILYPLAFFALKPWFPVAPRYYFAGLFAWLLLAAAWAVELARRFAAVPSGAGASGGGDGEARSSALSVALGRLAGLSGALVLCTSLAFGSYLYSLAGAGARERWRDAFAIVNARGAADAAVYVGAGRFQAHYYLEREVSPLPRGQAEWAALPPGSWVVARSRGARPPPHAAHLEPQARYPIPSKPWSWVIHTLRVPPKKAQRGRS